MSNFKSAAKRKRELAKLDKRNAKDQKRAVRKAERARTGSTAPALTITTAAPQRPAGHGVGADAAAASKPLTLAEVVQRWKNTKVGNAKAPPRGRSGKRL